MRFSSLLMSTLLVVAPIGVAHANLIQNGDFSQTTGGVNTPTQFGTGSRTTTGYSFTATNFVTGWTGNDGYQIWYPNASEATTVNAASEWSTTGKEMLWSVSNPPSTTAFVGLDGDQTQGVQSSISQTITGLVKGAMYKISFDWGGAQMQSRTGNTTEYLQVSLGNSTQNTQILSNVSKGFTGWYSTSLNFFAYSTTDVLKFLSVGTPSGYPPMAVLTNVSMATVPEPSSLALLGLGLVGFGLASRRRASRKNA